MTAKDIAAGPAPVLHHAALPHRGGAVRVARLLITAQRAAGIDARLSFEVAENNPETASQADPAAGQSDALPLCGPTLPANLVQTLAALPQNATVHLHTSTDWPALLGGLPAPQAQRRILITLHDASPLTGGCAYPLDCPHFPRCAEPCPRRFADARDRQAETAARLRALAPGVVSPSRWLARLARQVLPELPVRVIPNGVPWPELAALPARARARAILGIAPGAPMALFAAHGGARAAYKSGSRWPELWRALREGLPGATAFAVGGDETGEHDGLTVWPYVDRAKLTLLMRAADALVYPTLADNHPLVLLEAAAMELPVAGFAVGGLPEIVLDGETGLLAPPGDDDALLRCARALLADAALGHGLARRLGQAARAHGAKRFTAARMAADYAALTASPGHESAPAKPPQPNSL